MTPLRLSLFFLLINAVFCRHLPIQSEEITETINNDDNLKNLTITDESEEFPGEETVDVESIRDIEAAEEAEDEYGNYTGINKMAASSKNRNLPLLLVLQWPVGFGKEKARTHGADLGKIASFKRWTLHGLWPNGASDCDPTYKFSRSKISTFRHELEQHWPNFAVRKGGSKDAHEESFWSYEWSKHGTCSDHRLTKYFTLAKDLALKYTLERWLSANSVVPSNSQTYGKTQFDAAFHGHLTPKQFVLRCIFDKTNTLKEIQICLKADGKTLMSSCPSSVRSNCQSHFHYYRTV